MQTSDWYVIGISGVTCGGKSTLSKALHKRFSGSILLLQDDYFLPQTSDRHVLIPELNHFNWDCIGALDMDKMRDDVAKILKRKPDPGKPNFLFLDGFLLFVDEWLSSVCQKKYFLTLPYEECWRRRSPRVYDPPDVPGYFDKCVWPEYIKSKDLAFEMNKDLCEIDGLQDINEIVEVVAAEISKLTESYEDKTFNSS